MKRYTAPILALAIAVAMSACATTGTTSGGSSQSERDPAEDWTGPRPSDNLHTRSASLYLARAIENPDPEAKRNLYRQALEAAQEGTQTSPNNPKAWFLAGQAQLNLGNYMEADSLLDQADELFPYYEEVEQERRDAWIQAYNAGVTALQNGDMEGALAQLRNAAAIYAGRPGAYLQLGSLHARRGEPEEAIEAYRNALDILRGEVAEELDEETRAQWAENEEIAAFNLAQLLAQVGRDAEAAEAYRDFLARNPQHTSAKINLAVVLTRQGDAAEASEIYAELLSRTDLGAQEYLMTGIGLFQGEEYDRAAQAFQQSIELNPYSRDARYNLAQALYVRSGNLEEAREATEDEAERQQIDDQLVDIYQNLREVTEPLIEVDPYNRNAYALLARAYRGLADKSADDAATSDQWRNRALEVLRRHEQLPVDITQINMTLVDNQAQIRGRLTNVNLDAGTPVTLQFTLLGQDGSPVGEQSVTVTVPEPDADTSFEFTAEATGDVAGWRYEPQQ